MAVHALPMWMVGVVIILIALVILLVIAETFFKVKVVNSLCKLFMGTVGAGLGGISSSLTSTALQARCNWLNF